MEQETPGNQLSPLDAAMKNKVEEAIKRAATGAEQAPESSAQTPVPTVPKESILKVISRLGGKPPNAS